MPKVATKYSSQSSRLAKAMKKHGPKEILVRAWAAKHIHEILTDAINKHCADIVVMSVTIAPNGLDISATLKWQR